MPLWAFSRLALSWCVRHEPLWPNSHPFEDTLLAGSAAILCTGGLDVIRKEAWPFYTTISGVRLYWELEEPKGPTVESFCSKFHLFSGLKRDQLMRDLRYQHARNVPPSAEREFCIDNLLVRIHFIVVMIRWTGLAPWEFEFPFPSSLTSSFLNGTNMAATYPPRQLMSLPGSGESRCAGPRPGGCLRTPARTASVNLRTTTSQKCAVVPRRARI